MGFLVALRLDLVFRARIGAMSDTCVWAQLHSARLGFAPSLPITSEWAMPFQVGPVHGYCGHWEYRRVGSFRFNRFRYLE